MLEGLSILHQAHDRLAHELASGAPAHLGERRNLALQRLFNPQCQHADLLYDNV